jgi:hypothetical protein
MVQDGTLVRVPPLSRSDPFLGLAYLRQRFVRRGHEWKKAPAE